ncbi:MAG: NrtA/SsuA/CpmA family ABC transporter substrate-binding protein [Pseudobdellovibrio sp.]
MQKTNIYKHVFLITIKILSSSFLALALFACEKNKTKDEINVIESSLNAKKALQKITLAFTLQPQSALAHIAIAKGYFIEEGLDVQVSMHTFGKMALQAVLDSKADFATVAETPIMFNILKGEKIFILANIVSSSTNNAVLARKDAKIINPKDLKGKKVGYTPGTTGEFFLDSMLIANGLERKQIQSIALKPEEMLEAIQLKKVDAVSTWNYDLTLIKRELRSNGIIFYDREIYTETFNIVARQDFINKNPEAAKSLLRALIKSEKFISSNPNQAQEIMAKATKNDLSLIQEVWSSFNFSVVLDHTILLTLEDETRWAMKNKLIDPKAMPDYISFIYFDSLKAVKPDAIKMNR